MRPPPDPSANYGIPFTGQAAGGSPHSDNAVGSTGSGRVPLLNLAQAMQSRGESFRGPDLYAPLPSAMDTTRSQQLVNCSDCMMPCKLFLGLTKPKDRVPQQPKRHAFTKPCPPLMPVVPDSAGVSRTGRSLSIGHPGSRSGGRMPSDQSQPSAARAVPVVIYPQSSVLQQLSQTPQLHATTNTTFSSAQTAVYRSALQGQPGLVHQVAAPVFLPGQSTGGAVTAAPTGGAGQAASPVMYYATGTAQNANGEQIAVFVGPDGKYYVARTALYRRNRHRLPSQPPTGATGDMREQVRGRSVASMRVGIVPNRSQSVAPPSALAHAVPLCALDATGMARQGGSQLQEVREDTLGYLQESHADANASLGQEAHLVSSNGHQLAMELQARKKSSPDRSLLGMGTSMRAARDQCKAIHDMFKEENSHLKEENERLASIVKTVQQRISALHEQLRTSNREVDGGETLANVCSELISDILGSRAADNRQHDGFAAAASVPIIEGEQSKGEVIEDVTATPSATAAVGAETTSGPSGVIPRRISSGGKTPADTRGTAFLESEVTKPYPQALRGDAKTPGEAESTLAPVAAPNMILAVEVTAPEATEGVRVSQLTAVASLPDEAPAPVEKKASSGALPPLMAKKSLGVLPKKAEQALAQEVADAGTDEAHATPSAEVHAQEPTAVQAKYSQKLSTRRSLGTSDSASAVTQEEEEAPSEVVATSNESPPKRTSAAVEAPTEPPTAPIPASTLPTSPPSVHATTQRQHHPQRTQPQGDQGLADVHNKPELTAQLLKKEPPLWSSKAPPLIAKKRRQSHWQRQVTQVLRERQQRRRRRRRVV
ncbi:hypothetical protein Esti_006713 [Eimeria stiedai]